MHKAINIIMTRKSVRKFIDKEIEDEKIKTMLSAAMAAPSAVNKQPWDFIIVNDRKLLDKLGDEMPYAKMLYQAKLAIIVCGNLDKSLDGYEQEFWIQDCSNASMNILLAAHAQGLGAVWTAVYNDDSRIEKVRNILELPDKIIPLNIIPIGYPEVVNTKENSRYDVNNVHINKW